MIWYVFYRRPLESPQAMKFNCVTAERAEMRASRELSDWDDKWEIMYTLPAAEVCANCWHPWFMHDGNGCQFKGRSVLEGVSVNTRCSCRRKKKPAGK